MTNSERAAYDERVIRVFISSTFKDMQKERELLVKQVMPHLRGAVCHFQRGGSALGHH